MAAKTKRYVVVSGSRSSPGKVQASFTHLAKARKAAGARSASTTRGHHVRRSKG